MISYLIIKLSSEIENNNLLYTFFMGDDMKNSVKFFAMLLGMSFFLFSCEPGINDAPVEFDTIQQDSYIITLDETGNSTLGSAFDAKIDDILRKHNIERSAVTFTYNTVLFGFAAVLNQDQLNSLKTDKTVIATEKDQIFMLSDNQEFNKKDNFPTILAQTAPWGISAVGGSVAATDNTGIAWIIDTGIDLTHPDLNVNLSLSKTFVKTGTDASSANDLHGHGSHVAGIVGAKNNAIGSLGVCSGAELVAVKVLNYRGSGLTSEIIAGINYVAGNLVANRLNVVNMSIGGSASTTLDKAVTNLAAKGARVVIAAGNFSASVRNYSPARVVANNVYTISAYDNTGKFASFSNYGNPSIAYSAPGVSIYSTTKSGGYATMSGTSMASPHVAGILLANNGTINWSGYVTGDKDTSPDKKAIR